MPVAWALTSRSKASLYGMKAADPLTMCSQYRNRRCGIALWLRSCARATLVDPIRALRWSEESVQWAVGQ